MKRILFITAFVPSSISAGENFSRQLINDISRKNRVDLIFFKYKYNKDYVIESDNVKVLKVFRNSGLIKFINFIMFPVIFPLFSARFNLFRLIEIKKILRETPYDMAVFDFSQTFLFARFLKNIPIVLNSHDVIAQRYSRIYNGILVPFVKHSERFVLSKDGAKVFCHSEKDRLLLNQFYSVNSEVTTIFLEKNVIESTPEKVDDYFVFFANWARADNSKGLEWFISYVCPGLRNSEKFKIIGAGMPKKILSMISDHKNFEYLGYMPDPYKLISNSRALISPLFTGAGIKVKVIEAMSCGTPVIGTSITFEGVSDKYSRYLVRAESADEFLTSINTFSITLDEKRELKALFLKTYFRNTITDYINNN